VVCLEGLEELIEDLGISLFAREYIGMLGGIIHLSDVIDVYNAATVTIKLLEGSLHKGESC
jgi:hypothetical protein